MRKMQTLFFLAVVLMAVPAATPSYALFGGKVDAFSAEMVEIGPDGAIVHTAEFFVTEDAMRIDNPMGAGMGGQAPPDLTMLVLKKQGKSYVYNHDKKLVYQGPVDEEDLVSGYEAMDNVESEKVLGKEEVSGYTCVKKEVVTTYTEILGMTMTSTLIVWENEKFDFPLRTMDEDGGIQEMRNIDEGAPSAKLFRPLTGYRQVDNMMAVMGMDFAAMMGADEEMETEDQVDPGPEDMDVDATMERVRQAMGDRMNPEEEQELMDMLAYAMNQANQMDQGEGACDELWNIVPKRTGDVVGFEMKTEGIMDVVLGTGSTLRDVFDDYREKLSAAGWQDGGSYMQGDFGMMTMTKGERTVRISASDKPAGMEGDYTFYYDIQYSEPPQQ